MARKRCWFYREGVEAHLLSAWDQVDASGSIVQYHFVWSLLCPLQTAACSTAVTNRPGDGIQMDTLGIWVEDDIAKPFIVENTSLQYINVPIYVM